MPTTVHIPNELLRAVDARAKRLKLTRNRFVIEALKKALTERETGWSQDFIRGMTETSVDPSAVDEMMQAIKRGRSSKKAPEL